MCQLAAADFSLPKGGKESAGEDLFTNAFIPRLSIEIPETGMAILRTYRYRRGSDESERPSVSATVKEGNTVYTNVSSHLKGSLGSFRPIDSAKPGLTLSFDKLASGQRFHGLQKISLNNSVQDDSYLNDKLSRELFTKAGIPVPRADYATVELNGRYLGLYVLTEGWNKQFLHRFYKNAKGNLYDGGQVGRDVTMRMIAVSGQNREEQSELKTLAAAAAEPDPARRLTKLKELLDLDRFVTFLALDVMLWDWDGYAMNRNNYRIFHDLDSGKLVFFPHGMDQMFWNPEGPVVTGTKGVVARGFLKTAEGRRLYLERAAELRAKIFNVQTMTNRVHELAARLRPKIAESGLLALFQFERAVKNLNENIIERARSIDEQLEGARHLVALAKNQAVSLGNWTSRTEEGKLSFRQAKEKPATLEIQTDGNFAWGVWVSTVWLEEGRYKVTGRLKTAGVVSEHADERPGAGLRVISQRKITEGVHWDWFPFRQSRNYLTRSELPPVDDNYNRLEGDHDWTEVSYEFELRQPIADLEILCELRARKGAAWFDPQSLKLTRTGSVAER